MFDEKSEKRKNYVEWLTGNDTCHRPDILLYGFCDPCQFVEYCLCTKRKTSKCSPERIKRLRRKDK